jgi:hypothetical protein
LKLPDALRPFLVRHRSPCPLGDSEEGALDGVMVAASSSGCVDDESSQDAEPLADGAAVVAAVEEVAEPFSPLSSGSA